MTELDRLHLLQIIREESEGWIQPPLPRPRDFGGWRGRRVPAKPALDELEGGGLLDAYETR